MTIPVEIFAEAEVKHTEAPEKISDGFKKIFGEQGQISIEEGRVTFTSNDLESLTYLKNQFRDRRVRAAAKRLLLAASTELQTQLLLNKQAATVGIAALCDDPGESALGPIVLRIRSEHTPEVVEWLTQGYSEE